MGKERTRVRERLPSWSSKYSKGSLAKISKAGLKIGSYPPRRRGIKREAEACSSLRWWVLEPKARLRSWDTLCFWASLLLPWGLALHTTNLPSCLCHLTGIDENICVQDPTHCTHRYQIKTWLLPMLLSHQICQKPQQHNLNWVLRQIFLSPSFIGVSLFWKAMTPQLWWSNAKMVNFAGTPARRNGCAEG